MHTGDLHPIRGKSGWICITY